MRTKRQKGYDWEKFCSSKIHLTSLTIPLFFTDSWMREWGGAQVDLSTVHLEKKQRGKEKITLHLYECKVAGIIAPSQRQRLIATMKFLTFFFLQSKSYESVDARLYLISPRNCEM